MRKHLIRLAALLFVSVFSTGVAAFAADTSAKQTFVVVHGATAGGWEWKRAGQCLTDGGHTVYRVTLTGLGERMHLNGPQIDLQTHINDVVNTILFEDLHDVVLTGHSYGGMVITGVIDRIPERIKHVVYLDAAVPDDGQSIWDMFGGNPPNTNIVDGMMQVSWVKPGDNPPHSVAQSIKCFNQPVSYKNPAALALPVTYIAFVPKDKSAEERAKTDKSWQHAVARGWTIRTFPGHHVAHQEDPRGLATLIEQSVNDANKPATAPARPTPSTPRVKKPTGIEIVGTLPGPARPFREQDLAGYAMVYFKDQTHSAYLAVSRDGNTFTDVNGGEPVFDGELLAEQRGVRDPHIARGPDGAFYLAMTDLHIFGQRAGFRDTAWQRPEADHGWGNNRALVLMKSWDLIHWTHVIFRVDLAFPELGDIDCAWAPETTYDPVAKRMVVYFTIRYANKNANLYWAYADDAFTKLTTTPKMIPGIGGIDGDLTLVGDQWHLFYVGGAKIFHAVSPRFSDGFVGDTRRIDPETKPTEAPNLFRRLGTDTWVLMYDVYGARPNNMGFSETTDFVTFKDIGHFNEGTMKGTNFERPKHGAVTCLTADELAAVAAHWNIQITPK